MKHAMSLLALMAGMACAAPPPWIVQFDGTNLYYGPGGSNFVPWTIREDLDMREHGVTNASFYRLRDGGVISSEVGNGALFFYGGTNNEQPMIAFFAGDDWGALGGLYIYSGSNANSSIKFLTGPGPSAQPLTIYGDGQSVFGGPISVPTPTAPTNAASKGYVDDRTLTSTDTVTVTTMYITNAIFRDIADTNNYYSLAVSNGVTHWSLQP